MNAANLCPSFRAVTDTLKQLTADIDVDCSFQNRAKFTNLLEQCRSRLAGQLGVSSDDLALVRNTSEANNIINNGLPLESGDEVLIWDENHPTNNVAWDVRAARFGLKVVRVTVPATLHSETELLEAFTQRFSDRTRVLTVSHVSNVSGIRLPIAALTEAAHARGVHVHVDGAQSWGALALDLRALGVDSFSASAHKWYMGPREVGLLYVRPEKVDEVWPGVIAPGWGPSAETELKGARKFESLGQRDDAALAALGTAAELHDQIEPARVERRITFLAQRLKAGIASAGVGLVTPMDAALSHGVCIARVSSGDARELNNKLYQDYGIAGAPTGGLRLCPTIYNTPEHVDRAIEGVTQLLA
ncbi:MAG: aminotransferase class V-fold PLP-dependent enzyme [Pseudomonadota bacterium]|nr:aminotransferase class V-fold PLP-dependent enzyme [Pseudomonadota bacterium]